MKMAEKQHILIVEDEPDIAEALCFRLRRAGYACHYVTDGRAALELLERQPCDLLILDRMLPGLSGDEIAHRLRRHPRLAELPVLMLTAKADDADELAGFALGADDYVRKPFSIELLLARVAALLRRAGAVSGDRLSGGPVVVDCARREVTVAGEPVELTATEFKLMVALLKARGRVLERTQLIAAALGPHAVVTDRTIDVHISALRRKLGSAARCIRTFRGVGYAFRESE